MGRLFSKIVLLRFPSAPIVAFWLFVLLFLVSVRTSFFLELNEYFLIGLISVFLYFVCYTKSILQQNNQINRTTFFLLLLAALFGQRGNLNSYIGICIIILPVLILLIVKDDYKMALLQRFNKVIAALVTISLLAFILHILGVSLPYRSYKWKSYSFDDFTVFLTIPSDFYALTRFQFVFTEPGYFGCFMVFMIFLNKYDFKKWEVWSFFFALIFTYSLAGYILFFLGLAPFVLYNSKSKFKYLFILVLLLVGFLYLDSSSEDNFVTKMFSYRLQLEDGKLTGYNRTSDTFDYWFENSFIDSGKWLFGNNEELERIFPETDKMVGVDLRANIARYGIVQLFFYFGSMIFFYRKNKSKFGLWYFLLFALFYYRGYTVMYYIGFPILYYLGIQMLKIESVTERRVL